MSTPRTFHQPSHLVGQRSRSSAVRAQQVGGGEHEIGEGLDRKGLAPLDDSGASVAACVSAHVSIRLAAPMVSKRWARNSISCRYSSPEIATLKVPRMTCSRPRPRIQVC